MSSPIVFPGSAEPFLIPQPQSKRQACICMSGVRIQVAKTLLKPGGSSPCMQPLGSNGKQSHSLSSGETSALVELGKGEIGEQVLSAYEMDFSTML